MLLVERRRRSYQPSLLLRNFPAVVKRVGHALPSAALILPTLERVPQTPLSPPSLPHLPSFGLLRQFSLLYLRRFVRERD